MAAYVFRSSPQMAAILSCDKCSETYASPAELDYHRQLHDLDFNPVLFAARASRSRSASTTADQARAKYVIATPVVPGRQFHFCSKCNARFEIEHCRDRHSEQCTESKNGTPGGYLPQPPRVMPSPEVYWRPSSASGPSTSPGTSPVIYWPPVPVQPFQVPPSFRPSLAATAVNPQYVAHMPLIPEPAAIQAGVIGWVDFLKAVERLEPYNASAGLEGANMSILSGQFWQTPVDEQHPPVEVLGVSLERLCAFFDTGGFQRRYEPVQQEAFYFARTMIEQLCGNYFSYWQRHQPVFHKPTWRIQDYPTALVSAMACVGSLFTTDSERLQQLSYLNDRCISELTRLTAGPGQYQDIDYIAALCTHQIYFIGSCHQDLHKHVDRVRSYMIQGLQAQNLLGPGFFDPGEVLLLPGLSADTLYTEWRAWVSHEQKLRVAWMVVEYDCSLSLLTGRPCAIELGHLPKVFPCEDSLYNATDAQTWARLLETYSTSQGPAVSSIVNMTMSRLNLPATASSWAKRLCSQIFERVLRVFLEPDQQNIAITSAREINLHLTSSLSDIHMDLLSSISYLEKSASIYSQSVAALEARKVDDFDLLSTFKFVDHADHFDLCSRITQAIKFITLAAISPPGDSRFADLPRMQRKLMVAFGGVPCNARLYVYNAGQTLRVARESSLATPIDYLRLFTAYLFILAFVKYGPRSENDVPGADSFHADLFPFFPARSDIWIEYGGPVTVRECGVFYPGCKTNLIMQEAYRELCNPVGCKLKARFHQVLACFDALEVHRTDLGPSQPEDVTMLDSSE